MRILAIRGNNLASLAGPFEINFEAEPIGSSGIFAITGPTGAGKSTLLDAVCLALFAEIPRLRVAPASGNIGAQEDSLGARDARSILRHGTGEGHAEVEFSMPNGARYRARWEVRRARSRADGRLQSPTHSFERTDTHERIGGTKTETLKAIAEIIGLSAEQFTRAVLLAQGDFEAFIRADANERAHLLEKLTGSQIYAQLGQRAFAKAKVLQTELENFSLQIKALHGLDDASRAEAEHSLQNAEHEHGLATAQIATLEAEVRRQAQGQKLVLAVLEAQEKQQNAAQINEIAAPRREALRQDRQAFTLTPLLVSQSKAQQDLLNAEAKFTGANHALHLASEDAAKCSDAARASESVHGAQEQKQQALAPALEAARTLDRQIAEANDHLQAASKLVHDYKQDCATAQTELSTAEAAHNAAKVRIETAQAWLNDNTKLRALNEREKELLNLILTHENIDAQRQTAVHSIPPLEAQEQAALTDFSNAEKAIVSANTAAESAFEAKSLAEQNLAPADSLEALNLTLDRIGDAQLLLEKSTQVSRSLERAQSDLIEVQKRRENIATQAANNTVLLEENKGLQTRLVEDLKYAKRVLEQSLLASGQATEALREHLVEGEPCPVCGAKEHVLSALGSLLGEHLEENRLRSETLEKELETLRDQQRTVSLEQNNLVTQDNDLTTREVALQNEVPDLQKSANQLYRDTQAQITNLSLLSTQELLPQLDELRTTLQTQRTTWQRAQVQADQARKAADQTRKVLDQAQTDAKTATDRLRLQAEALKEARVKLSRLTESAQGHAASLDSALSPIVDWHALPDAAVWVQTQVLQWRKQDHVKEEAEKALPILTTAFQEAVRAHDIAKTQVHHALADQKKHAGQLTIHQAARAKLLDGHSVQSVEQANALALSQTLDALDRTRKAREIAQQNQAAASAAFKSAEERLQQAKADCATAQQDLEIALSQADISLAHVQRVASAGLHALDIEAQALSELESTAREAQAVFAKCQSDLEQHHAQERETGIAPIEADLLQASLVAAEQALKTTSDAREEARLKIRQDDAVREKTAKLRTQLDEANGRAAVWLKLSSLIGDATGNKFRRFAQGLTLDRLLEHANARLLELKPRYALERSSGGDMLIQVIDNDMAGQKRGLHNLSGGERFLVSLALALGLAEMSTVNGVRIESLFIDEGFGALDPSSLGQALGLLEHLHASGRRVGIISHVEELKERIPVKIEITPSGRGTSRIEVVSS